MLTQACRWGWRESNPAQWAEPPSIPNDEPVVPRPEEVLQLIEAAKQSRRPEHARAMLVAATTGVRRAELCALRRSRDIDWDKGVLTVSCSIIDLARQPVREIPTKNRRTRRVALDEATLSMLAAQVEMLSARAAAAGIALDGDAYLFSDAADGTVPWKPGVLTRNFARLRERVGLEHLDFHYLRKFMETYGQDMGFSPAAVAMTHQRRETVRSATHHHGGASVDRLRSEIGPQILLTGGSPAHDGDERPVGTSNDATAAAKARSAAAILPV